jgi:hypothetical protein
MGTPCISQAVTQILEAFDMRILCVILVILNFGHVDQLRSLSHIRPYMDLSMYLISHFTDYDVGQYCTLLCCVYISVYILCENVYNNRLHDSTVYYHLWHG